MSRRFRRQRCTATAADGSRCGRMCPEGAVVCSKHDPNRPPTGIIAQQAALRDTDDLGEIIRRLTKDKDPSIRLRAIDLLMKWEERRLATCEACAARKKADAERTHFIASLTPDEKATLTMITQAFRDFKETVYTRDPELRPDEDVCVVAVEPSSPSTEPTDVIDQREESPRTTAAVPEPSAVREPPDVPHERYAAAGLIEVNGSLTHALGDEYAQRILRGDIPLEDAIAAHAAAERQDRRMGARPAIWHGQPDHRRPHSPSRQE